MFAGTLANDGIGASNEGWDAIRKIDASGFVTTVGRSSSPATNYAPPPGSPTIITSRMSSLATAPDGTIYVTSGCAVGKILLP